MYTMLICSVGGTSQPVIASIRANNPSRVVLWHTRATKNAAETAITVAGIHPGLVDLRIVRDEGNFASCVQDARSLRDDIDKWFARSEQHDLIVDFTGGTKLMSAALALVAHRWNCRFSYIGGKERTKEGIGTVKDGSENAVVCANPFDSLAYQPIIDSIELYNAGFAASAAQLLDPVIQCRELDPSVKRSLTAVQHLFHAYAAWDAFRHADAAAKFEQVHKTMNDLNAAIQNHNLQATLRDHQNHCRRLSELNHAPSMELVADLVANADRRAAAFQFDDAVARLYRATEAFAQAALAPFNINTSRVTLDQLPPPLHNQCQPDSSGCCKLGLQQSFVLLRTLDASSAASFFESKLDQDTSPLVARNQSILAHGFQPTTERSYNALRRAIAKLVPEGKDLSFPRIPSP